MKKIYLILTSILLLTLQLQAQTPNALSYQGVARDAAGLVLSSKAIGLRFTIHQANANGTVVYQETQSTTTNLLGLFTVAIGNGTLVTGSFSGIGWGSNKEYLQVEMDASGGTAYLNMGTNEFLSVPYAITAGSSSSSWNLTGNSSTGGTDYIGTTDANDLIIKAHNNEVMRVANSANNVGIGTSTPDPGAVLDVTSSTKGFLIPRMAGNPANPVQGLMYYNTTTGCFLFYTGTLWEPIVCPCPNPIGTPGAISGITTFCPGTSGVSYSVAPVANATSYLWTIPAGVGTIASGMGSNAITINMASTSGTITVAAVNSCGAGNVSTLALTGATLPSISSSPTSVAIISTATGTFAVVATGTGLTYQWQVSTDNGVTYNPVSNSSVYSNATTATLTIANPDISLNGNKYNVVVTGLCGTPQTSTAATLTVCPGSVTTPGTIVGSTTYCPSTTGLVYSVPLETFATSYTWTLPSGFTVVSGGTTNSITVNAGTSSGTVSVKASNACATSGTNSLAVAVGAVPSIASSGQPANKAVNAPTSTTFVVTATGAGLTYQWQLSTDGGVTFNALTNTAPYSNVTTNTLGITSPTLSMNGYVYKVTVSGTCGSPVTSNAATLTVCAGALGSTGAIVGTSPVCPSTQVVYSIPLVTNATSYSWSVPATAGTILSGAGTNSITLLTAGSTTSSITVTPVNACQNGTVATKSVSYSTGPVITVQPKGTASVGGANATFAVTATGTISGYQWQVSTNGGTSYTPLTNGAPYSGVLTNTLTITAPTVGMNGYLYKVVVSGTGTCASETSIPVALGVCTNPEVQFAVVNKSTTALPANFVVQVPVNFSSYTTFGEDANLDNIEFTANASATNSGTPLYAWLENGQAASSSAATKPTSSSTAPVVWVNLGANPIPVGGTLYIYLNFMGSPVMTGPTSFTGMAPQLTGLTTPSYGSLDNGALVFPFYDNFAGTSFNASNWSSFIGKSSGSSNGTTTVNNGITFTSVAPNANNINIMTSLTTFSGSFYAEAYTKGPVPVSGPRSFQPGLMALDATTYATHNLSLGNNIVDNGPLNSTSFPSETFVIAFSDGQNGSVQYSCIQGNNSVNQEHTVGTTYGSAYNVITIGYNGGGTDFFFANYTTSLTSYTSTDQPTGSLHLTIGSGENSGATGTPVSVSYYWTRIRTFPLGNTAPTVTVTGTGCY